MAIFELTLFISTPKSIVNKVPRNKPPIIKYELPPVPIVKIDKHFLGIFFTYKFVLSALAGVIGEFYFFYWFFGS